MNLLQFIFKGRRTCGGIFIATLFIFLYNPIYAQWSGVYGNEWLVGKYSQEWVKVSVSAKGVHRIALKGNFVGKANQLHLYHRGGEVALISATNAEIEFFGVPNDGASDALLYRPYTGTRMNPYYSWFSDASAYFLTYSSSSETKLAKQQEFIEVSGSPEPYHIQKELTVYSDDYTHDESTNPISFALDQSFYDESKAMTGKAYYKFGSSGNPVFDFSFQLKKVVKDISLKPKFEVLINSRTLATHTVKSAIGKNVTTLREFEPNLVFNTFAPYKKKFELNTSSDIDINGNGTFRLESVTTTNNLNTLGIFSIAYILIEYPQILEMSDSSVAYFNFNPTSNSTSRIQIKNVPIGSRVYDISDYRSPKLLPSTNTAGRLELMASRISNQELKIMVTGLGVLNEKVSSVKFTEIDVPSYNYLIVSNSSLFNKAKEYGAYRNSVAGGSYKSIVVSITDLYNQFNYGEPSPVAIRRFVDFMIKDGVTSKHNLLLVGPSTTIPKLLRLHRELPEEVPTFGFPGSDILLVEGLKNGIAEVPSLPVGRISATLPEQIENYLSKVKEYESNSTELVWKKNILHLSGGKSASELNQLKSELESITPIVENEYLGGFVKQIVKKSLIEVESVDISKEVNKGVGLISYLGHGSPTTTDLDYGYASDISRTYSNKGKYPLQYYNGCGVGNIFSGRHDLSPTSNFRLPVSTDWLTAKDKGSIAVIANTYYSFISTSSNYLEKLYHEMYGSSSSNMTTIGRIQQKTIARILLENKSSYDIANVHQSLLQGDPAIVPIGISKPDLTFDANVPIVLSNSENTVISDHAKLLISGNLVNKGIQSENTSVSLNLIVSYRDGGKVQLESSLKTNNSLLEFKFEFDNQGPISNIQLVIDSDDKISELIESNNSLEFAINWDEIKNSSQWILTSMVDIIPPISQITLEGHPLTANKKIFSGQLIKVLISDNNAMRIDTNLVGVFLRPCLDNSCDYQRRNYDDFQIKGFKLVGKELQLYVNTIDLDIGSWELQINFSDVAGNISEFATVIPFEMIKSEVEVVRLSVWPNPATNYVCFDFTQTPFELNNYKLQIFNSSGVLMKETLVTNEKWFWNCENFVSGMYFYKIELLDKPKSILSGKIAIVN